MAIALHELVGWLDRELGTSSIPDYPGAVNGLQLENRGEVVRVAAAVDASLPVIEKAVADGAGLLLVHHGLFWQGAQPVAGPLFRKLRMAMEAGLAVYSSHIPLDIHPVWGNNRLLADAIGLAEPEPFFEWRGVSLGFRGRWSGSRTDLIACVADAVSGAVHVCPGGPEFPKKLGIITGGAGAEVEKVATLGVDTLITGEGPHWTYGMAEELGVNLLYAGHYATETFGVKALAAAVSREFGIPWRFLDHPTGL